MTTLKILIESTKPAGSELIAEHGLSFFVETARRKFIFDCGHTGAAFDNAKIMGVELRGIKFAVLSHSHYDHAGGFPKLLEFAQIEKVFTGENFWQEKFSNELYRGCGFKEEFLTARGIRQEICRDVLELDKDTWLVSNFKRRYDFEVIPKKFLRGAKRTPDDFSDEIVLIMREGDGLAIVTACAHAGILNIVADVREQFSLPINSVIGGLHLTGATPERISRTLAELKNFGVKKILPCHCSGEEFMNHFDARLSTGSVIEI
ncbi:MAG: MBL fold metallo-hydrolase [Selenomonadaceae bacterium]|nr:MBL fold metallo-hydrolase [Selenomonadaceae bacterium]